MVEDKDSPTPPLEAELPARATRRSSPVDPQIVPRVTRRSPNSESEVQRITRRSPNLEAEVQRITRRSPNLDPDAQGATRGSPNSEGTQSPNLEGEAALRQTRRAIAANHTNGTSNGAADITPSSSNGNGGGLPCWECSVCTYKNIEEEFKCAMCETRKGTSTRKPRATSQVTNQNQVVQIQALAAELVTKQTNAALRRQRRRLLHESRGPGAVSRLGRLKNIDRNRGTKINVTVNNITVVITDYPELKSPVSTASNATTSPAPSVGDAD